MPRDAFAANRRWEREPVTLPISLVLRAEQFKKDDSASTLDISLYGVSVRTRLALGQGDWVGMVIKGEFAHAIPTRVVWVREDTDSRFTVAGLEFLDTLMGLTGITAIAQGAQRGGEQLSA